MPCAHCGSLNADKKCGKCFVTYYCSRECQQLHWKVHKKICSKLANEYRKQQDQGGGDAAASERASDTLDSTNGKNSETIPSAVSSLAEDTRNKVQISPSGAQDPGNLSMANPQSTNSKSTSSNPHDMASSTAKIVAPRSIPSKPYKPPANLSDLGKEIYFKLKPVLEGPADKIRDTLPETMFCEITGHQTRQVDTRVLFLFHQLLQETLKADPLSTVEPFKRMLAIKVMINKPDDAGFASWASIVGQQCLVRAQEIRLRAVKASNAPKNPDGAIQLPTEILQEVGWLQMDAVAILHLANEFFTSAVETGDTKMLGSMKPSAAQNMSDMVKVVLGFALRHTPDTNGARKSLWRSIADSSGEKQASVFARALTTYALAFEACKSEDNETFEKYILQSQKLWKELGGDVRTLLGFVDRHISMGVCKECAAEMSGVMDGHEIRFRQFLQVAAPQSSAPMNTNGASTATSNGDGKAKGGQGARLVPGGGSDLNESSSSKSNVQDQGASLAAIAASRVGIVQLEAELKKGYALYKEGKLVVNSLGDFRLEAGMDHFAKVLKKAYELPLSGMSVSLIYSLSHAHIEGALQIRRWGKAEATMFKLKEIAEYSETRVIPHAIPTVSDQLHLWWREKHANMFSRQRKFDKAIDTLEGSIPHAEKVSRSAVAAVMVLLTSAHVEAFLSGSPRADLNSLQEALDKGIAALKSDPPPVGGAAAGSGDGPHGPAAQWAAQAKLEHWIKVLPMLRSLESEGLQLESAEAVLVPLAKKYELQIGETIFNAEQFLSNSMTENNGVTKKLRGMNGTTLMLVMAVLVPLALMLWLAFVALNSGNDSSYEL